jgi:hypothetical protein
MKLAGIFFILTCFFCQVAFAERADPKTQAENLLKVLKPGETELAIETFADGSLMKSKSVDQVTSQARVLLPTERKILGFEFVGEQNIGTSVKRLTYVVKTDEQPLSWIFLFYKPDATWLPMRLVVADHSFF